MKTLRTLAFALTVAGLAGLAGTASAAMPNRVVLDNGLTVILAPIAGSGQVAVNSFYRTGFADEPEGMPQASHLLEHLVCQSATKSFSAGQSFALLNKGRTANAETMNCFTYFDYCVRSADLGLVLQVEAERLSGLQIVQANINTELPKLYTETHNVEAKPDAGMFKYAFAALGQAWRYRAASVTVKSGLEKAPIVKIEEYRQSRYQPSGCVLVIVGDFDQVKALSMVKQQFGSIPSQKVTPAKPIEWDKLPGKMEVKWDSNVRGVCIAFRPTGTAVDSYILHAMGGLLASQLASDDKLNAVADFVTYSDPVVTLNGLPFYIYATAREGISAEELQKTLETRLQEIVSLPQIKDYVARAISIVQQIGRVPVPQRDAITSAAKQMLAGMDSKQAEGMIMGQVAMEFGFEEMITKGNPNALAIPAGTTAESQLARIKVMVHPAREFVTVLTPMEGSRP